MTQLTLLDMTQSILSAMDSDEVNSIGDTTESLQVANIIRNKYYDIIARGDLPQQETLLQLDPSTDPTKPTLMYVPAGVSKIDWIKYYDSNPNDGQQESQFGAYSHDVNTDVVETQNPGGTGHAPGYKYVSMIPIDEFLDMTNRLDTSLSTTGVYLFVEGGRSFSVNYNNDKQPQWCTIIENTYVLFDSYDVGFDDTLQASKVMAYGTQVSSFRLEDNFIPDIDDNQFPLLLNEAKSLAFYELKQMPHAKAEQEIKRQWSSVQKGKSVSNKPSYFDQIANFGRTPRTGGYASYGVNRWMRGH